MMQAVVLIHGIGEQKPMSTLRSFVSAVLGSPSPDRDSYWSKPDPMSESFELRRLHALGRRKTHFYEYYWAYNVEGTNLWHVVRWLWSLIRRRGRDVPESSKPLWWVMRCLMAVILPLTATGSLAANYGKLKDLTPLSLSWALASGFGAMAYFFIVYYLGDAARYCSAAPQNIKLRQTIRAEGLKLLRTLHQRGDYDRIIIVGHSLGSVIGYDLITRLWQEYHDQYPALAKPEVKAKLRAGMARKKGLQHELRHLIPTAAGSLQPSSSREKVKAFQDEQHKGLVELQFFGNPWRITDFITLGSPLAHAMLLLANSKEDFERRKRQRELPTCPPQRDKRGYAFPCKPPVKVGEGKTFTPLILHHAAPFAVTRWTNLYFPARLGLLGDIVGGRLRPEFGNGILDIEVRTQALSRIFDHTLLAHTRYWHEKKFQPAAGTPDRKLSLEALREALALPGRRKHPSAKAPSEEDTPSRQGHRCATP